MVGTGWVGGIKYQVARGRYKYRVSGISLEFRILNIKYRISPFSLSRKINNYQPQARETNYECLKRGSKKKGVKNRNQGVRSGGNLIAYLIPRNKYLCVELLNLAQLLVIIIVVIIVP